MKITAVKVRQVRGTMPTEGPFWEERLVRPVDIYPEFRKEQHLAEYGRQVDDRSLEIEAFFLTIETDDGVSGLAGPFREPCAHIVATQLRPILTGQDPLATEYLWDVMHRLLVHGRQGEAMFAISVVDCALWDLKGKWLGQPVWRILGGPTRDRDPGLRQHAGLRGARSGPWCASARSPPRSRAFGAQKWFFRHGPMSGREGLAKNVELVRTLRETLGDDDEIMLDCWQSFDYRYLLELAARIEEYRPYWLEEAALPDRIDTYRRIKDKIRIPLAGAEHDYTRWGMKRFIEQAALDVYQPDPYWCGGLSEDAQDRGADHRPRPDLHPARPLDAGQRHLLGAAVADPHALSGVPGQVERGAPVLVRGAARARARRDPPARVPGSVPGAGREQGRGERGALSALPTGPSHGPLLQSGRDRCFD